MNRRTFVLRAGAFAGGLAALSGCTDTTLEESESQPPPLEERFDAAAVDLPVSTESDIAAEGIERAAGADVESVEAFEAYLREQEVAVESVEPKKEEGEALLSVEYVHGDAVERGLLYDLGIVAGGYAALVDAGVDAEKLKATLLDPGGRKFGEYEIPTDYAERYNAGEITAEEYARLASKKLTSK